jgi:hypothetical protein
MHSWLGLWTYGGAAAGGGCLVLAPRLLRGLPGQHGCWCGWAMWRLLAYFVNRGVGGGHMRKRAVVHLASHLEPSPVVLNPPTPHLGAEGTSVLAAGIGRSHALRA